jgi:imidazolonepropionase-like amidohydrolase
MVSYYADGPDECRKAVRKIFRPGADQIKFWATGGGNNYIDRYTDIHYTEEEIRAICEEAKLIEGTKVLAHCENPELSKVCIEAGVDSIEHCDGYAPFLCDLMKEHNVYLVPTMRLLVKWIEDITSSDFTDFLDETLPKFFQRDLLSNVDHEAADLEEVEQVKAAFLHAYENGIKIGLGSDTCFEKSTPYGWYGVLELECMQECGMPADQVIRSATKINSEILGLEDAIGTIEEGKLADLLVVSKDPTEDVRVFKDNEVIEYIYMGGELVVDHGRMLL